MGRPPSSGGPAFRFTQNEVAEMEAILQEHKLQVPSKDLIVALSEKFSQSTERAGKVLVQTKQISLTMEIRKWRGQRELWFQTLKIYMYVWNWFQNKRYALRSKFAKPPVKLIVTQLPREDVGPARNVPQGLQYHPVQSGRNVSENPQMEFEAKSARDGAWYDVQAFVSHRYLDTGNPEVLVRFAGFGLDEEEWVNVRKHVRQRSLPCESSECVAILPGDLILCFQEGKDQALYFDAHVLDAQRRRHDVRGCRCRLLVRYDHGQTEEIVPLRKVCRRPETDYRLQQLSLSEPASVTQMVAADPTTGAIIKPAITNDAVQLNHKPAPTPSTSVVPTPNASASPGTAASEPKKVETGPVYISFAGSAPAGDSTAPSETTKQ